MMEGIGKKPAHLRKKKYKKESYVSLLWKCFDSILDFFFFFSPPQDGTLCLMDT